MTTVMMMMMLIAFALASLIYASPTHNPTPSQDCLSRTVCLDGVNACGQPWGTCIPDCRPLSYTTPPCIAPRVTALPTTIEAATTSSPTSACSPLTLCIDFVDPCGQGYGGCYDICGGEPSWTKPSCDIEPTMGVGGDVADEEGRD